MTGGPLSGIRVLDLSRVLAGPYCTMLLADLGAEVLKIERPDLGDDLRLWGPPFGPGGDSSYFQAVNRNKSSIAVDLKSPSGLRLAQHLARTVDVVVENFRSGMADQLGLGYDALSADNPGLVYCSITGFGQSGPWSDRPGYDILLQAMGGLMSVTGEPAGSPMRVGVAIVDVCTGLFAALGISSALRARDRSGRGQRVEVSLLESVLAVQPNLTAGYLVSKAVPTRLGNGHPNVVPYGVFQTADGHIVLAIGNDAMWQGLVSVLGVADDVTDRGWERSAARTLARDEVDAIVAGWCRRYTTAALTAVLEEGGIPHGPVLSVPDALALEQVRALGTTVTHPMPGGQTRELVRTPIRFSGGERTELLPPPLLVRPSRKQLDDLGVPGELIADLEAAGGLGAPSHTDD